MSPKCFISKLLRQCEAYCASATGVDARLRIEKAPNGASMPVGAKLIVGVTGSMLLHRGRDWQFICR